MKKLLSRDEFDKLSKTQIPCDYDADLLISEIAKNPSDYVMETQTDVHTIYHLEVDVTANKLFVDWKNRDKVSSLPVTYEIDTIRNTLKFGRWIFYKLDQGGHPLKDILIAIANNVPVQVKPIGYVTWQDFDTTGFFSMNPKDQYRIRPEKKNVDVFRIMYFTKDEPTIPVITELFYESIDAFMKANVCTIAHCELIERSKKTIEV